MIKINIKEEDKKIFARERYEHPHPRVRQRMSVLHLTQLAEFSPKKA